MTYEAGTCWQDLFVFRGLPEGYRFQSLLVAIVVLGGSWVVISGVISPLICIMTIVTLLITPPIATHEPPSSLRLD